MPFVALIVTFAITVTFICANSGLLVFKQVNQELQNNSIKVQTIIQGEVERYIFGLQAARGVFIANDFKFDRQIFKKYARSRDFFENFTGSLGFGFIRLVKQQDFAKYTSDQRKNFAVHPYLQGESHMVVEIIEPLEKNIQALGLDIAFEQNRLEAAWLSAKTGQVALSNKIILVQQNLNYIGFLGLLPIYKTGETPTSEAERLVNLIGWTFTPIVLSELLKNIGSKLPLDLSVKIFVEKQEVAAHISEEVSESWIFRNKTAGVIAVAGQTWTLEILAQTRQQEILLIGLILIYICSLIIIFVSGVFIYRYISKKEKSHSENAKWLNAIIESAGHSVIATDSNGIISTFNSTAERMLGYSATEVVGKFTPALIHDSTEVGERSRILSLELGRIIQPGFETFIEKAKTGGSDINEWTYIKKNGERFPVRLCVTGIFGLENQIIGYLGIAEDLTENKKLLETIEAQRLKMVQTAKMSLLGEMAGGMAHEINTPLAVIAGCADLLTRKFKSQNFQPKECIGDIETIENTIHKIAKIIRGLRAFSRNSEYDQPENILLSTIIMSTLDLCKEKMLRDGIDLQINLHGDVYVCVRQTEIAQVFMNLLSNAVDAVADISDKWVKIETQIRAEKVEIKFCDNGSGIDEKIIDKIMNPFFTTKAVGKGTGLGLSISKGIVESHNGTLKYSSLASYTEFVVSLNVART